MDDAQFRRIQLKLAQNPKPVLSAARNGSPGEMMVLANAWNEPPSQISYHEALDVFLVHLQENRVPNSMNDRFTPPQNLPFSSMLGISKMGEILREDGPAVRRLADAWAGIYKWSVYIFSSRIEGLDRMERRRRAAIDVLSAFWYCICFRDVIRAQMVGTTATVEIATRLWLEEDDGPPKRINAPVGTWLLGCLLREAKAEQLDRVLKMTSGKATEVAKLSIARLQRSLKGPNYEPSSISTYLDLIYAFSRQRDHPLRHALLSANVIWVVSGALVKLSVLVNTSRDPGFLDPMVSAFGYLRNCLESTDGFTWIGAGFLQAFCECSTRFAELEAEDYRMLEQLISEVLPPYLVYRSVIEAANSALAKIERGVQKQRVEASKAKVLWRTFAQLAHERMMIVRRAEAEKGTKIICDNMKCQKANKKEDVRRCSACLSTYYCSKECQETAWKEGDHKTMCKLKQRARLEGRADNVSKRDYEFLHYLAMFDARLHISELRKIAERDFPNTPPTQLVVHIDQSVTPPTYGVQELKTYKLDQRLVGSTNEEARNEALVEKVQDNPEHYTIIDMTTRGGSTLQMLMTLATGGFWLLDEVELLESSPGARASQQEFERVLDWVFRAAEDFEKSELRRRVRSKKLLS